MLRARLVVLRLLLWLMLLRLLVILLRLMLVMLIVLVRLLLLLARIVGLRLLRRVRLAGLRLIVAVLVTVIGLIAGRSAGLLLEVRLALAKLFLRGGDQAKVMLGVLIIMLGGDRVPGALRVTG